MSKKRYNYAIPSGYGYGSPMDSRRMFSDLISRAIDQNLFPNDSLIFGRVYQHAVNLTSGCCFYCNSKLTERDNARPALVQGSYAWDHFVPASYYGLFIIGNVVLACATCNLEKSNATAEEYWESRQDRNLPLRFKTREAFQKVANELAELEKINNIADFYPSRDDESDPTDILEACRIVGASEVASEFLESYTPSVFARWLCTTRDDADILTQLADVTDDAGLYKLYEERNKRRCQGDSRSDVRGRISRFTEIMEEVTGRTDVRKLTKREYRATIKFTMEKFHDKIGERNKHKMLFRILVEHPDLAKLRPIAWDQDVMV